MENDAVDEKRSVVVIIVYSVLLRATRFRPSADQRIHKHARRNSCMYEARDNQRVCTQISVSSRTGGVQSGIVKKKAKKKSLQIVLLRFRHYKHKMYCNIFLITMSVAKNVYRMDKIHVNVSRYKAKDMDIGFFFTRYKILDVLPSNSSYDTY